jgi:peptide/nickel transport system substrate-binding protein/oligopeptide transport system substrate-binding protein
MAVNKSHLLQLLNGRGTVANGVLPPSLPGFGHRDISAMYPYNPSEAKKLLKKAGYPHGFSTELGLASEQTGRNAIGTEVQADLSAIGIKVSLKPLPAEATAMAQVPMLTYSWYMDYPDPSDFINGFCTSPAVVGGSNPAFLNDPVLDKMEAAAQSMPLTNKRVQAYRKIDERVMQDAAYVPLYYPELTVYHSANVHGLRPVGYFPAIYSHLTVTNTP